MFVEGRKSAGWRNRENGIRESLWQLRQEEVNIYGLIMAWTGSALEKDEVRSITGRPHATTPNIRIYTNNTDTNPTRNGADTLINSATMLRYTTRAWM